MPPPTDGGFTADLNKSKAKSRSGHRSTGNKQLNDKMKMDSQFRKEMEKEGGFAKFHKKKTIKTVRVSGKI